MLIRIATFLLITFTLGCASLAIAPASQPATGAISVDPNWTSATLSNGFQYHLYPIDGAEVEMRLIVNVGSLNERDDQRGYAHFIEHMAFNGTKHFPGNTVVNAFSTEGLQFGPDINALTDYGRTVYKLALPDPNKIDVALDWFRDIGDGLTLNPAEIENEIGVVFGEWRFDNRKDAAWQLKLYDSLLSESQYSLRDPIGTESTLKKINATSLRTFYEYWYQANRIQLVVVGGFDPKQISAEIEKTFSGLRTVSSTPFSHQITELENEVHYPLTISAPKGQSPAVILSFSLGVYSEPSTLIQQRTMWLDWLVNDVINMRLAEQFDRRGINYNNFYHSYAFTPGWDRYEITVEINAQQREKVLYSIAKDFASLRDKGINDSEFNAVMDRFKSFGYWLQQYMPLEVAENAINKLYFNKLPQDPAERMTNYRRFFSQLSHSEINARLQWLLTEPKLELTLVYNNGDDISDAALLKKFYFANLNQQGDDVAIAYHNINIPDPPQSEADNSAAVKIDDNLYEWRMPNGIKVQFYQMDHPSLMTHVTLQAKGGISSLDLKERAALDMMNETYRNGHVANFNAIDFIHYLESYGIAITPLVEENSHHYAMYTQRNNLPYALNALRYFIKNVTPSKTAFYLEKERLINRLINISSSPYNEFERASMRMVYPDSSYAAPISLATYQAVTFDDVNHVYQKLFGDLGSFNVYVVSEHDLPSVKQEISTYLGALPVNRKETQPNQLTYNPLGGELVKHLSPEERTFIEIVHISAVESRDVNAIFTEDMLNRILQTRYTQIMREDYGFDYNPYFISFAGDGDNAILTTMTALISPETEPQFERVWPTILKTLTRPVSTEERDIAAHQLEREVINMTNNGRYMIAALARYDIWNYDSSALLNPHSVIKRINKTHLNSLVNRLFSDTVQFKSVLRQKTD